MNEKVITFGIVSMIGGTILALIYLVLWLWLPMPEVVIKIAGSGVIGGLLIMIFGLFIPNKK